MEGFTIEPSGGGKVSSFRVSIEGEPPIERMLAFESELYRLIGGRKTILELDLGKLKKLHKAGVGMILGIISSVRQDGGHVVISNIPGKVEADMKSIGAGGLLETAE